ncbi:hypothetical protein [Ideonella sp. YS5]|uniref:hypothetical protein n=1 Tax=Ideonella sp. YS5 TaxID=3453714 RepID=UPI003EEFC7E1
MPADAAWAGGAGARAGKRPLFRRLLRGLVGVLAAVLALAAAWVASNLVDSAPTELPSVLRLPAPAVPDERNAFFVLVGVAAPPGADPSAWGREQWSANEDGARSSWQAVKQPFEGMLDCAEADLGCKAALERDSARLADEVGRHAELGRRCLAAIDDMPFEERLPPVEEAQRMLLRNASHALGASTCGRWWAGVALSAAARGDRVGVADALDHASRLGNALLAGSRSLLGHAVAWGVARRTWRVAAAIVAAYPSLLEPASRATSTLSEGATDATRWMAYEANFARASIAEATGAACRTPLETVSPDRGWGDRLVCLGLLPNLTKTRSDAVWLQALAAVRQGLPPALSRPPFVEPQSDWPRLAWRNTLGGVLLDIGTPLYAPYVARQADVALHHAALQLAFALTREHVPVDRRPAWLDTQVLAPQLRGRTRLEGDVLVVDHLGATRGMNRPQDLIRIPLARV